MHRLSTGSMWALFGMALTYLMILLYAGLKLTT